MAVGTGEHRDAARRVHADLAALEQARACTERPRDVRRRDPAGLDVAAVADASLQALGLARLAARRETRHVRQLLGLVHRGVVVARVVLQRHGCLVRKLGDEVAAADLVLRQAQVPGTAADQALQHVGGLGPAGATVGIHRRGVGEPGVHLHVDLRGGVLPGQQRGIEDGGHRGGERGQVGPQVCIGLHAQSQELAVRVHRHLGLCHVVAAVRIGQEGLAAVGGPLDGAVQLPRRPGERHVFRVQEDLGAEAAAHVGGDDTHLVLRQAQHESRHQQALHVRVLVGHVQRVLVGGAVVGTDGRAGLHRIGHQAVVAEGDLRDLGRAGEHRVDRGLVADGPLVAAVVRRSVVQGRGLGSIAHIHHRRQHVVVHLHGLGGIARLLQRVRHHHCDVIAHVADLALRQHGMRRLLHGLPVRAGDQPAAGQAVHLAFQVLAGEHPCDAGHRLRPRHFDAADHRVRMRRAHEHGIALVRQVDVVGVLARAGDEAQVFLAPHGLADVRQLREIGCTHCLPPYGLAAMADWPI